MFFLQCVLPRYKVSFQRHKGKVVQQKSDTCTYGCPDSCDLDIMYKRYIKLAYSNFDVFSTKYRTSWAIFLHRLTKIAKGPSPQIQFEGFLYVVESIFS